VVEARNVVPFPLRFKWHFTVISLFQNPMLFSEGPTARYWNAEKRGMGAPLPSIRNASIPWRENALCVPDIRQNLIENENHNPSIRNSWIVSGQPFHRDGSTLLDH